MRKRAWLAGISAAASAALPGVAGGADARDLSGVWTNAWLTQMERGKDFSSLVVPEAAAAKWEAENQRPKPPEDPVGQADSEFPENGVQLARIRGTARSSWIYDPPDGKIPYTDAAKAANKASGEARRGAIDGPERLSLRDRCMNTMQVGPPLANAEDLNVYQIVQTPDHVAIQSEANSLVRVIRVGGRHEAKAPPRWFGDSVGRWEGATLVVETIGFHPAQIPGPDGKAAASHRVVERFTRTGPNEIHYAFTVENPAIYTRSWRGEMVLRPISRIFEDGCHEGNYAMTHILAGSRVTEREAAQQKAVEATPASAAGR
jgi:hypothetical protein